MRRRGSSELDEAPWVVLRQVAADYTDEPCVAPSGLGRSWSFTKRGKATSVTVNGSLVVTINEVGLAAEVAGLVSMTVGAARNEISEGLLVRVLVDWEMGEVELHAVFPARKAAKPSARAFVDLLASSTVMIFLFWVAVALRVPSGPAGMALIDPCVPP
ncbi:MAG TPA: LysR substrate-binding domain-containing protein [Solirubrobacteraceae bacterium]